MRDDPKRGFFCLDWETLQDLELYGTENFNEYQRLEIFLLPCNHIHTDLGEDSDVIPKECIADREA